MNVRAQTIMFSGWGLFCLLQFSFLGLQHIDKQKQDPTAAVPLLVPQ